MYSFTAAHRYIPLGSYVRVTNLRNKRSIVVLVNDRTAKHNKRLDLSYVAALKLGISGTNTVLIEVLTGK
jgi:rare lipoprotein A